VASPLRLIPVLLALCVTALVLVGCGKSAPAARQRARDGTITGVAQPCVGMAINLGEYGKIPVTVYLTQGSRAVAQQSVTGKHIYRFNVPAGGYTVATHQGSLKPVDVIVHPGRTTHADILSYCA
jgi:hypothetical protein